MGNIKLCLKTNAKAFCCTREDGATLSLSLHSKIYILTYQLIHVQQNRHLKQPYLWNFEGFTVCSCVEGDINVQIFPQFWEAAGVVCPHPLRSSNWGKGMCLCWDLHIDYSHVQTEYLKPFMGYFSPSTRQKNALRPFIFSNRALCFRKCLQIHLSTCIKNQHK